jgi:predicted lipid-binding transport protein (Tim44 family)
MSTAFYPLGYLNNLVITMSFSWTSVKISIAGAKLSHLVQQDKIWDHGSMVEQARTVFNHLKKAYYRRDSELVKKCVTEKCFKRIEYEIENALKTSEIIERNIEHVQIISVAPKKNGHPDRFRALLKLKKSDDKYGSINYESNGNGHYSQEWLFERQGDWWLLDRIKIKVAALNF